MSRTLLPAFVLLPALLLHCLSAQTLVNSQPRVPLRPGFASGSNVTRAQLLGTTRADLGMESSDSAAPRMRIRPVDGVVLPVRWDRIEAAHVSGGTVWVGGVEDSELSEAVMVVTGEMVAANFTRYDGRIYQIRTTDAGEIWGMELDANAPGPDEPAGFRGLEQPLGTGAVKADSAAPIHAARYRAADDGSQIDVLVVWTPAARLKAGGAQAIRQQVQLGETETNQGYRNSGINLRLSVVNAEEISYTESSSIDTDLNRLVSTTDGYIDSVHQLRDAWGADLVSMWVEKDNSPDNACGIGNMLQNRADRAFTVVALGCATGYYSFGHEIGHNLGAMHARGDSTGTGYYDYSWGYKVNGVFRTVMAYDSGCNCTRVNYWSSPLGTYQGRSTGFPADSATPTDNARTLNNTKALVAAFRQSRNGGSGGSGGGSGGGAGLPESDHPYGNNADTTWSYTQAGNPSSINVTFDARTAFEAGYDYLYVTDGSGRAVTGSPFTGTALAGRTVTVGGATLRLRLTSDGDTSLWGFRVSSVTANAGSGQALPKLEVTSMTAPREAVIGVRNVTVRAALSNTGSAAAGRFRLTFYVSRDTAVSTQDISTGYFCTFENGLAAGATSACSGDIQLPATISPGVWYLGAVADDEFAVQQSDRSRNTRVADTGSTTIYATDAAELTQPAANATLTSGTVTFAWTSGVNASGYSLSVGSSSGASDIAQRDAGTARQLQIGNLPTDGSTLYVRLVTRLSSGDTRRRDYTFRAATIGNAYAPKISLDGFTAPTAGTPGVNLTGTRVSVSNTGNVDLPSFRVGYYFGTTPNVTTRDVFSGWSCSFAEGLVKGGSTSCSGDIGVPASLAPGRYYLAAIADDQNHIPTLDRSAATRLADGGVITIDGNSPAELTSPENGSVISAQPVTFRWTAGSPGAAQYYITIGGQTGGNELYDGSQGLGRSGSISGLPQDGRVVWVRLWTRFGDNWLSRDYSFRMADSRVALPAKLVVSTFTAPTTGTAGTNLSNTRMTVTNTGSGVAAAFRVGYYFGTTPNVTTSDVYTGWYCNVDRGLAPGASFTCTGDLGVPESLPGGRYYLAAIADDQGRVAGQTGGAESTRVNENGVVTIQGRASGSVLPESPHPYSDNEDRTWTYTLPGSRALTVLFDARTEVEDGYDFLYIYDAGRNLVSGPWTGTALANRSVSVPGDTVRVRLTSDESVALWGFRVTSVTAGTGNAKLVVSSFTAPTAGAPGQDLKGLRAVIQNTGTAAAGRFRLGFYLGQSPTVNTGDIFTGWYCTFADGLAAGNSTSCNGDIKVPDFVSPGRWYLAAIADDQSEVSQAERSGASRTSDNGPLTLRQDANDAAANVEPPAEGFTQQAETRDAGPADGHRNRPSKH